ncbi:MAG: hypothetical protein ACEPOZ_19020 [Marinifilaceae bacterium]
MIQIFHIEDGYVSFDYPENSARSLLLTWVQKNYGYANILMGVFISIWVKIFFRKYGYNFFEILILLCFVMGIFMLLLSVFGLLEGVTKINMMQKAGLIGIVYCSWAIGQFFDRTKITNYLKASLAYFLGMLTFTFLVSGLGYLIDML